MNQSLSDRQTRILDYIESVTRVRNYPPSVREIGEAVGLSSSSTVHNHLNQLERRGLIHRDPSKSRTVQLVDRGVPSPSPRPKSDGTVSIPILGNVAAGTPILAEQNIEDYVSLSAGLAQEGWFALRVRGDSMINAGILDGDLVVIRPQPDATDGTIVVALVDGDATVKRLDRSTGRVRLLAENADYAPIVPDQVSLVGAVRAVLRTY